MFALRIEYLTGRCVATRYNDRTAAEWPPHPARVFSALVSAWAEDQREDERAALDWLASAGPPAIAASEASVRSVVSHFVPVNDTAVLRTFDSQVARLEEMERQCREVSRSELESETAGDQNAADKLKKQRAKLLAGFEKQQVGLRQLKYRDQQPGEDSATLRVQAVQLLPETRGRQARTFPSVTPYDPIVYLSWDADPDASVRLLLDAIARRVIRIGHSSSFVSCSVVNNVPEPTLVPRDDGSHVLRVPASGQVGRLLDAFTRHCEVEPRVLSAGFQRYGSPRLVARPEQSTIFSQEWIVLRQVGGPRMTSTLAVDFAQALRASLMSHGEDPLPELLTGHEENGDASRKPHAAMVSLPFVGSDHATGIVLGIVIVCPRNANPDERIRLLGALGRWEHEARTLSDDEWVDAPALELRLGARGIVVLERVAWGPAPVATLRSETWCRPSRCWLSATPVALDRNPGNLFGKDTSAVAKAFESASAIIAESCTRIGLPAPARVDVLPSVTMPGVSKARSFAPFPADSRKTQRVKVHALLEFDEPVHGPILLGAGRYQGLGLFRPVGDR